MFDFVFSRASSHFVRRPRVLSVSVGLEIDEMVGRRKKQRFWGLIHEYGCE